MRVCALNALPATLPGGVDAVYDRDQSALLVFVALDLLHEKLPPPQVERMEDAARSRFVTSPPTAPKPWRPG